MKLRVKQRGKIWAVQKKFPWRWKTVQLYSTHEGRPIGGAFFTTEVLAKELMEGIIAGRKFKGIAGWR
jgi:hypothetical protein